MTQTPEPAPTSAEERKKWAAWDGTTGQALGHEDCAHAVHRLIADVDRLQQNLRHSGACDLCWTTSWVPVEREEDCRIADHPHPEEGHMMCGYCFLEKRHALLQRQLEEATGLLRRCNEAFLEAGHDETRESWVTWWERCVEPLARPLQFFLARQEEPGE